MLEHVVYAAYKYDSLYVQVAHNTVFFSLALYHSFIAAHTLDDNKTVVLPKFKDLSFDVNHLVDMINKLEQLERVELPDELIVSQSIHLLIIKDNLPQ